MTPSRALLAALALAACARYQVRPPEPPGDPHARRSAEVEACRRGALPPWLDEDALARATTADLGEAQASSANEQFHGSTYTSQPPTSPAGPNAQRIWEGRRDFERWCAALRSAGRGRATP